MWRTLKLRIRPLRILVSNIVNFFKHRDVLISVNGHYLIVDRFEYTQNHIAIKRYEPEITQFLKENLKKDDNIIDIGANIGYYSSLMAELTNGEVLAFEPLPDNFKRLVLNIRLNQHQNICPHQIAISSSNGSVFLAINPYNQGGNFILDAESSSAIKHKLTRIEVETRTIDSIVKEKDIHGIKIDVEGHEIKVLLGMKKTLRSKALRFVIIETRNRCAEITSFMREFDFFRLNLETGVISDSVNEDDLNSIYIRNLGR